MQSAMIASAPASEWIESLTIRSSSSAGNDVHAHPDQANVEPVGEQLPQRFFPERAAPMQPARPREPRLGGPCAPGQFPQGLRNTALLEEQFENGADLRRFLFIDVQP